MQATGPPLGPRHAPLSQDINQKKGKLKKHKKQNRAREIESQSQFFGKQTNRLTWPPPPPTTLPLLNQCICVWVCGCVCVAEAEEGGYFRLNVKCVDWKAASASASGSSSARAPKNAGKSRWLNVNEICCKSVKNRDTEDEDEDEALEWLSCQTAQSVSVSGCWPHN